MKIKEGYILRSVANTNVVVDTKGSTNLGRMITLNSTGAYLWKMLENGCSEEEMTVSMSRDFGADEAVVREDVMRFIANMKEAGVLE